MKEYQFLLMVFVALGVYALAEHSRSGCVLNSESGLNLCSFQEKKPSPSHKQDWKFAKNMWPFYGVVQNQSSEQVFVLVNGHYRELPPGKSTSDHFFFANDVDGVWCGKEFYPVNGGECVIISTDGKPTNIFKQPWDGSHKESSPYARGASDNTCPKSEDFHHS